MSDMSPATDSNIGPTEKPALRWSTREQRDTDIEKKYGAEVRKILRGSVQDQRRAVEQLHNAGLNGQAQSLLNEYLGHEQEFARFDAVQKKWYEKGAVGVLTAPVRWGWRFAKKHPYITTAAVLTIATGAGLYYAGYLPLLYGGLKGYFGPYLAQAQEWMRGVGERLGVGDKVAAAKDAVGDAMEKGKGMFDKAKDAVPSSGPEVLPPPTPRPSLIPSPDEAAKILEDLDKMK